MCLFSPGSFEGPCRACCGIGAQHMFTEWMNEMDVITVKVFCTKLHIKSELQWIHFYIKFKWRTLLCEKVRIYSWPSIFTESVSASLPTCENVFGTLKSILAFMGNHRLVETLTHSTHTSPDELSSCFCFHTIKNCPLSGLLPVTCICFFCAFLFSGDFSLKYTQAKHWSTFWCS